MEVAKTDNVKEKVSDIDNSSRLKVSYGIEHVEEKTFRCDVPPNEVGLSQEYMKHEEDIKEGDVTSCDTEMGIKTEPDDTKDEVNVIERELNHEPLTIKYKDAVECVLSNKSDLVHGQYMNDTKTIKCEKNVEQEDTSSGIKVDMEKQNLVQQCQPNCYEYGIGNVEKHCEHRTNSERRESSFSGNRVKDKSILRAYIEATTLEGSVKHQRTKYDHLPRIFSKFFDCELCNYKTECRNMLKQHCILKHDEATEIFHCAFCDYRTKVRRNLLQHHNSNHVSTEVFHCKQCNYRTKFKHNLLVHQKSKHDDAAEIFHCKVCDFKTKWRQSLSLHNRLKHEDAAEIFHCKMCDFKTKIKQNLWQHHRHKHDDAAEIFHCKACDFKTKSKQNLLRHHRSKHDDAAELFYCKMCDFKTKDKHNLLKHHRSKHNDAVVEILHCKLCDFETRSKDYLRKHYKFKHDNAVKTFDCELCDFSTKYKSSLRLHHKSRH